MSPIKAATTFFKEDFFLTFGDCFLFSFSEFTTEKIKSIADWLLERTTVRPKIAIVCGSGLGGLGERLKNAQVFPYESVPNFPKSTGKLLLVTLVGVA